MPILHFADGSTSTIRVRQPLELFCSASTMLCYFAHKRHGDRYDSEPPGSEPAVLTVSQLHQDLIRLIGRAVSIEVDDRFLVLIHGLWAEAVAAEQEPEREAIVFSTSIPREPVEQPTPISRLRQ